MNIYIYVLILALVVCATGISIAIKHRKRTIICPNCSTATKFAPTARVGLCPRCATEYEFPQFSLHNNTRFGIVCLKKKTEG